VSVKALEADASETLAKRQAALEENARLALWRMDSFIAPLAAQESARPYFTYTSFYSAERAYGKMFNRKGEADITVPSPLLIQGTPFVRLHFQYEPQNSLTSPEVPQGAIVGKAVPEYLSDEQLRDNLGCLTGLQKTLDLSSLLADLPQPVAATTAPAMAAPNNGALAVGNGGFGTAAQPSVNSFNGSLANAPAMMNGPPQISQADPNANAADSQQPQFQQQVKDSQPLSQSLEQQGARGQKEFQARQRSVAQNNSVSQYSGNNFEGNVNPGQPSEVQMSMMTPLWLAGDLVLARRVQVGGREFVQGCLLDWSGNDGLKQQLLNDISDLLPSADLLPVTNPSDSNEVRRLASLPLKLIPGNLMEITSAGLSPIKLSLLLACGAMLLAALAVAVLLRGVVALSERRAAFVSAVTHELRTPLTTFRMYAEMLSEGMVPQESDRRSYLETLRIEADRLTHLVANVLAYARLERGRPGGRIETVAVEKLLKVATQRLADRASQANLNLTVEPADGVISRQVKADPAAVEQILFNLVDNACKYAATATDRTLHLSVKATDGQVLIRLQDHGPGIAASESRRLFQAFQKSAQEAALSAPGVGLGLALSQRLARDMHGDLRFEPGPDDTGASFTLSLPVA
jgi:signal transduction histidine kinase